MAEKRTWLVTHHGDNLKPGDLFTGEDLPLWLVGKVRELPAAVFEVATPAPEPEPAKPKRARARKETE